VLDTLAAQIKALAAQITEQLGLYADAHVFTSLPPLPGPSAPPGCSPRSATAALASQTRNR